MAPAAPTTGPAAFALHTDEGDSHDHCPVAAHRREESAQDPAGLEIGTITRPAMSPTLAWAEPCLEAVHTPVALLALAPKTSPPVA